MLKNIKIGKKLIAAFLLVTIISGISGIIGVCMMTAMNAQFSGALVNYGFAQGDIGVFNTEFNNNLILIRDVIIQTDNAGKENSIKQLNASSLALSNYLNGMQKDMVNDQERGYYNTIKSSLNEFTAVRGQVMLFAQINNSADAFQLMTQKCTPLSDKIRTAVVALEKEKTGNGNRLLADLNAKSTQSETIMLIVSAVSVLLSVLIAVLISRSVSKPVSGLLAATNRVANGDLSVRIDAKSKDEIGQLSAALEETIGTLNQYITDIREKLACVETGDLTVSNDSEYKGDFVELIHSIVGIVQFMNETITEMKEASQQIANGSEQVSSGAQALARGAAEQAGSIEKLSGSIAEISLQISENEGHVSEASAHAEDVSAEIEICNQQMRQMVQAMEKINDSSNRISQIIKTIENIAFQTNILALNAAVEAARAGDAGKGFAVVADEVRMLAGKSAEAAKNTTVLIRNSITEVEQGSQVVDQTAQSLHRVVKSAKAVFETVEYISASAQKQVDAIQQINQSVAQISGVVQTNSATAQESAAASEELSGQAQAMRTLAEKFILKK